MYIKFNINYLYSYFDFTVSNTKLKTIIANVVQYKYPKVHIYTLYIS